jgi:hypothetical protein
MSNIFKVPDDLSIESPSSSLNEQTSSWHSLKNTFLIECLFPSSQFKLPTLILFAHISIGGGWGLSVGSMHLPDGPRRLSPFNEFFGSNSRQDLVTSINVFLY